MVLNHKFRAATKEQRVQIGELNAQVEDSLLGEKVVKAFTAEDTELKKFADGNEQLKTIKKKRYYAMANLNMCIRLFDGLMYSVTIIAGGLFLVYGKINAGDLVMYMLYVSTLIATIRRLVEFAEQFSQGITGIERFFEIMDTPIDIKDAEDAKELEVSGGEIEFDNVSFEYPDDHNRVLHELCLKIKSGENLALVGESGGGKTTTASLIPRFYDVTSGAVKIDGQDIKNGCNSVAHIIKFPTELAAAPIAGAHNTLNPAPTSIVTAGVTRISTFVSFETSFPTSLATIAIK